MEEFELYSCEELWEFFKKTILNQCQRLLIGYQIKENKTNNPEIYTLELLFLNQEKKIITLRYDDFCLIYDKLKGMNSSLNSILYSDKHIEVPILSRNYFLPNHKTIPRSKKFNNIIFELDYASPEFGLFILNNSLKIYSEENLTSPPDFLFCNLFLDNYKGKPETIITEDLLYGFCLLFTLKITLENSCDFIYKKHLVNNFLFDMVHNSNISFGYFKDIYEILQIDKELTDIDLNNHFNCAGTNNYKSNLLDYYLLAKSSNDPFARYLSYYHVLEYFFDEIFNKNLRKQFQDKITSPSFSNTDTDELNKVINFIKKETKNCRENGQGNELESLKLVLKEFIDRDKLQKRLSSEQIEYFQKNQISFSHAPTFSFKDKEGFYNNLAKRIYQTRNALVHSKEGTNVYNYNPYQDSEELSKEIPLIKLIAELVIINSSTPL